MGPALALSPHSTTPVTVVARLEQVLRRAGEPLHYEILRRLTTEERYVMLGKDPTANLIARLSKWPQFVRMAPGTYTLREGQGRSAGGN